MSGLTRPDYTTERSVRYRLAPYTLQYRDCGLVRLTTYILYNDSCPGHRISSKQTIIFPSLDLGVHVESGRERSEVGPPNQSGRE